MLKKPPQHSADATPVLILGADPAWDKERIDKELAEAKAENDRRSEQADGDDKPDLLNLGEHPSIRYSSGATRYDLDANCVWRGKPGTARDYLKPGEEPTRFVLRRLSWDEYHACASLAEGGRITRELKLRACRYGLADIENGGKAGLYVDPDASERSYEEMQRLHDWDPNLALLIGQAVFIASSPLTDAEKKA